MILDQHLGEPMSDRAEPQLSPTEAELARAGAIISRYQEGDLFSRIKAIHAGIAMALGTSMPTDEEIRALMETITPEDQ
jgi:hypothetical protein